MKRTQRSVLLLVVLGILVLASTMSGVSSAALSSDGRLESNIGSASGPAPEVTPTPAPQTPPDDNWDGTAPGLVSPPEMQPVLPSPDDNWDGTAPGLELSPESPAVPLPPDRNIAPGVSALEAPPAALPDSGELAPLAVEEVEFPATGDVVSVQSDPYWYHAGDYAQGSRTLGLDRVAGVKYDLAIDHNVLSSSGHVDLELSINGVVVGSFSVAPGETSKSVTFFFSPISGPNYTVRLRETNTVGGGLGSIVIPLDTSPITFYDSTTSAFPATGDVVSVQSHPYWYQVGDYAQGSRTPGLNRVTGVRYDLAIDRNVLSGSGHVDLELSINGVAVGSFSVAPGETSKSVTFFFPPISGPTYTIRLRETNRVDPGLGSIVIPLDTSPITFYDSTTSAFFPAAGDVTDVQSDPYWYQAGDYAQGVRVPGLDHVAGVQYDLTIDRNVLSSSGHVDLALSINGVVVGHFSVLPGETSKSVVFFFSPISGPTYTVQLRETNTVGPGLGSIVIPLDRSPITFYDSTTSAFFPATGDATDVQSHPYWFHAGDYAIGSRTPGLNRVNGVLYHLMIEDNVLSDSGHVDLELSINGVVVENFTVLPGETSKWVVLFFPPISGPDYVIRLRETNTVASGLGSVVIPLDRSPIWLISSVYIPLVLNEAESVQR